MKTNTLLTVSVVALGTLFAASAQAGWSVGVSVHTPVYYPAPVYVTAPPICQPPVMVCPPPRVVCYPPRPVCPPVVYVPPCHTWGRYDYDRYERHDWRRDDWRNDRRDDRRDDRRSHDDRGHDWDDRSNRGGWHR